jgi:NAD-dependent dihydropyrimidine dehydrogenase PreA subunit
MANVYENLAHHLDQLPGGFPATDSGVELKILKKLFSEEQARIAVALSLKPEPVKAIADRLKMATGELHAILDQMSSKGLIFKMKKNETLFMSAQFVIGIWEYHVNDLDPELIQLFNEYVPYLAKQWTRQKTNQLRVIPISKSLNAGIKIMPYEVAEDIIRTQSKIVVAQCICRKEHAMVGKGCDNPLEVCLVFGTGAFYYENNGLGRSIDREEALEILCKGIDAGLVLQPGNSKKAMNICMCCGCCCQVLKNLKALPNPAQNINSNYMAMVDPDACVGCGICKERCHMKAITVDDDTAHIDLDQCIGCGVCIPTCETKAISLSTKPADQQWDPPKTLYNTYLNIARERGLI